MDRTRETTSGGGVALRLFAALHVPRERATLLTEDAEVAARDLPDARVLDAEQLHVTFAFLGNVAEEYVPIVAGALEDAARLVPGPTSCSFGPPVALGRGRAIGFDAVFDLHALLDVARDAFVDTVRAYAPDVDDRPWHPHVTVLRTTTAEDGERALEALRTSVWSGSCIISDLHLYASLPAPGGRVHKLLHTAPLGMAVPAS